MRPRVLRVLVLGGAILALVLSGCAHPPGRRGFGRPALSVEQVRAAQGMLQQLRARAADEEWAEAETLAMEILETYPAFESEAEVLWIGSSAARHRGRLRTAEELWQTLIRDHPQSGYSMQAQWELAELYRSRGQWESEARTLIALHDRLDASQPRRDQVRQRLRALLDQDLDLSALDVLAREFGRTFIGSSAHWAALRRAETEEVGPRELGRRLEVFLRDYPQSRHRDEARAWLARLARDGQYETPEDLRLARVDRIGVLCPLSGEYATLGQALYDGALLALEEHNRASGDSLSMVGLDTRGDEVVAVQAARTLIEKDRVIAIVGALTSSTTTAVAVLCQERGVPLVSPTATNENISQLGEFVFQTNLTRDFETRLVAQAAVQALLRRRFAILYPDDEDGRAKADVFAAEIEALGARVVASEPLHRGQTDFRQAITRVREAGPEALFLPIAPSEMRLLGPQLVFHDLRVQLLGPSTWINTGLLRQAQDSLDRAVVPSDQALVSQAESEHFARQWRRRFPERAANPFAQKSYFAMRRVINSLDPTGEDTRERLRSKIAAAFLAPGLQGGSPFLKLRVLAEGKEFPFPVEDFPGLQNPPPAEADSLDHHDLPLESDGVDPAGDASG